jgi:hypothetical protein
MTLAIAMIMSQQLAVAADDHNRHARAPEVQGDIRIFHWENFQVGLCHQENATLIISRSGNAHFVSKIVARNRRTKIWHSTVILYADSGKEASGRKRASVEIDHHRGSARNKIDFGYDFTFASELFDHINDATEDSSC